MPQTILIIDDSPAVHALIAARLKEEPVTLHFASSGREGLELAARLSPDLILLDMEMPHQDGLDVCRQLKSDELLINTPVIFLVGAGSGSERLRGLDAGAVDYVSKPIEAAELRARVRAGLRMKFMTDLLTTKAQIDALTGLWNRRYFEQRLDAEISLTNRASRPLSVLILDLDEFRLINDRGGLPTGDEVLRRTAHLLIESVRNEDVVCRFGGDEFAIIAPNVGAGAEVLAERLRNTIASPQFFSGARPVKLTTSIGVSITSNHADARIVNTALDAVRRAKESGRNRVEATTVAPSINIAVQKPAA